MIVAWVCEAVGVVEDLPDPGDELVEELAPLGVVEQGSPHRSDLDKAGQSQMGQGARQSTVKVKE